MLLLKGKARKAIAMEMQRSQHTIDSHLKTLYRAVGVGDRARLMLIAQAMLESELTLLANRPTVAVERSRRAAFATVVI
jgi:hypothetical protein